ncbi:MAG: right-handed parallel beta-helix repeat-containing protein [Blastocatellia bacterium]
MAGTEYFVSGSGDDRNKGLALTAPFRTIQKAANLGAPGDVINVMDGEYTNACANCPVVDITRSGKADNWIVFRAYPGHKPVLRYNGWHGFQIKGGASYIEISGFEVQGNRADMTFEYCRAERNNNNPLCNGNGITIDGRNDGGNKPHHIRIARNRIWQVPGGGINAIQTDYVTIEDNLVYENAWHSRFANSGVSVYQAWNFDDQPGPKIIIQRHQVFNNRSLVDWSVTNKLSDGNGIIIDDLRNTQNNSTLGVYRGGVRVENNLVFNNGGAGIQTFFSDQVEIINNTAYKNGQVVGYADILVNQSGQVRVLNNIAYSRRSALPINVLQSRDTRVDYNLTFNGIASVTGPNDRQADPRFAAPGTEWGQCDFHLLPGSPAAGSGERAFAPAQDLEGAARSTNDGVTRGALETIAGRTRRETPGRRVADH